MVQALRSAQWASANKSSLATIFANPIYRGVKVFNRETRVEGEHGRKRRRNPQQDVVTSEVEAIVPEQLWSRVQEMLTRRRANRLPVRRYAGGYVLTELLRCACGSRMAGTNSRERRSYRCLVAVPRSVRITSKLGSWTASGPRSSLRMRSARWSLSSTKTSERGPSIAVQTSTERAPKCAGSSRDLFERVDVFSRKLKAVAVWNMTTDQGVNRSDAVSEWLRR
jgi:hypothetical protein